jgi:cobalt/nickel transport system permease protein
MGGSHRHPLVHDEGPLHRIAPQCKLLATVLFVFAVVATPKEQFWAFGVLAGLVVAAAAIGRLPLFGVARRLVIEVPFLLFAVLLPLIGRDPTVEVLGRQLSQPGLWAAWNIVAKGTLGVAASIVLASTTSMPHLLQGLERLHVPRQLVAITGFMVRYGDVVGDELRRMRLARESRGAGTGRIGHARAVATSAGALFVRSYERGERVYLAMASRGYVGTMPVRSARATWRAWLVCLLWPVAAAVVAVVAWRVGR